MNEYDSLLERKYSGDESFDVRRSLQHLYDEIIDNPKSHASMEVTQMDYQVDGTFDMDWLI